MFESLLKKVMGRLPFCKKCENYTKKEMTCECFPSGHFYSALPDRDVKNAFLKREIDCKFALSGIDLHIEKQVALLKEFRQFYKECHFPEKKKREYRYHFKNPAYSYSDALTLYSMMRFYKPKRIVEIGSGYSSCVMLDTNERFFDGEINLKFIEPYPALLYSLLKRNDNKDDVIPRRVQDVDIRLFSELEEDDILFIDSSHVSKLNSDVNMIIFEILPLLKKGVLIHFHDIFWPFEYPKKWIAEGRAWNEAYLLRAFLEFNDAFEILFFSNLLHQKESDFFKQNMPKFLLNPGANFWCKKVKDT